MHEPPRKPGKYGRAFDWRLSHGSEPLSNEAAVGMSRLSTSDFPDILEDFLSISRKRQQNPTALARLQVHMLEELLIQETAIKHYRTRLAELEPATASGSAEDGSQKEIKFAKGERFFHRVYSNAIRGIGDGIAWRAFGYDRAAMRLLGERATKQHLSSEGTIEELREWSYHFDTGSGIAILNALTNCLAIGDVTVVRHDGSIEIVEVKSSKTKSTRTIRQKRAMKDVVTLLGTGGGQNEGKEVAIEILAVTPETSLDRVEELLKTAGEEGCAARRISDWLYVEAYDFRKFTSEDGVKEGTRKMREAAIGDWEKSGDYVHDMNTLNAIGYTPNCAPFSIFPFRARMCVDLLMGAMFYVTFLNINGVEREFTRRGWTLKKDFETLMTEKSQEAMLEVQKGPFYCSVTPADFMRMQTETLRPKTLMDAMEAKYRQGPNEASYVLALFRDEHKLWN